jgi:Secretion system C-terminal sorting domain
MHIKSNTPLLSIQANLQSSASKLIFPISKLPIMKKRLLQVCILSFLTLLFSIFSLVLSAQTVVTFSTPGSGPGIPANQWLCPAGVTSVQVECWGAGGAGGGNTASNTRGGGGGGGAYTISTVTVIPGTTYIIAVGAGQAGTNTTGPNGLASSFNFVSVVANPGTGGGSGATGTAGISGTGGTYNGGNGAAGSGANSGGGGGGAGSGGAGGDASGITAGAAGAIDGGIGGLGFSSGANAGNSGATYGGGGSGSRVGGSASTRLGGNGANGFVRLTFTPVLGPCVTPTAQPTSLILTPSITSIAGSFTASASANRYLVVRTATATAPTNPVNGTTYTAGTSALGGFIESIGAATTFNSTGLSSGVQYWYWVYGYNAVNCSGGPLYRTVSPLTGTSTTIACGALINTVTLTNTSTTTLNWSSLGWSLGHVPTACESALIILNRSTGTSTITVTINLDINFSVFNFTMINASFAPGKTLFGTSGNVLANIAGNMSLSAPGANQFSRCVYGNANINNINGNVILGTPTPSTTEGHASIGSAGGGTLYTYNLYGNFTYNPRGYTTDQEAIFNFDKAGTQYIYNYTRATDTVEAVLFETLNIGVTNATTVIFAGTSFDAYIEAEKAAGVTIGVNSTLDLPGNYSLNKLTNYSNVAEPFNMLAGSKLRLGGDKSIDVYGVIRGVAGSNFPANFNSYNFNANSTVEYYGNNAITQTIYDGANYANLIAINGSGVGVGRAQKNTTGPLTVNTSFSINGSADVTLGTLGSSNATVNTSGPIAVAGGPSTANAGGLYCNANVISGTGSYSMGNFSTLGSGHPQGIATSGATGNLQMTGTRSLNSAGNYVYNGLVNQIVGAGIPGATNDFTIDNPGMVTTSANRAVRGVTLLKQGTFDIGATTHTCENAGTMTSTGGKMKADAGTVQMKGNTGIAQNLSGNWFVNKTISTLINTNTKGITVAATPSDTLLISTALNYGSINNSEIITNDNLTLLSRATRTANFGDITNAGANTGNIITGRVNIERYLFGGKAWRFLAAPVDITTSPFISAAWRESVSALTTTGYGTAITGPSGPNAQLDYSSPRGSMKWYNDAANVWTELSNTTTTKIANTQGYMVFVRGDRGEANTTTGAGTATNLRIKGMVRTGDQTFNVLANKFQSFGNPYPARIDFRTVTKTNIALAFTVWNPNAFGNYNVGAYETYVWNGTNYVRGATIRNFIESGEAVFVQSNGVTAGTVVVKESDKGTGSALVSRVGVTRPTLEVNMYTKDSNGADYLADGVMLNFDNTFSASIDNMDVRKINNTYDNLAIKNGNYALVVERRPNLVQTDTIKLSIVGMRVATYRLEIDPSVLVYPGLEALLKDKYLQTETPISFSAVTTQSFDITTDAASKVSDRFMIVFKQAPTTNFTTIAATRNADKTVTVNWGTQNETLVTNYSVEQSNDGINFTTIATKAATANNGTNPTYSSIDAAATIATNWYRIKANNINSTAKYSAIAMVNALSAEAINTIAKMSISPNPIDESKVNVRFENEANGNYSVKLINVTGQVIHTENVRVQNNNTLRTIQLGAMAKGTYQAIITDASGKQTTIGFMVK